MEKENSAEKIREKERDGQIGNRVDWRLRNRQTDKHKKEENQKMPGQEC